MKKSDSHYGMRNRFLFLVRNKSYAYIVFPRRKLPQSVYQNGES
jgi:hypothetical protein